jgi:uncharacterized protein YbbK (DUF523 family)
VSDRRARLGVSACLLGQRVRYDGAHKRHALCEELARRVDFVAVCPEVELGLGTPRAPIRLLAGEGGEVRLVAPSSGRDLTQPMTAFSAARVAGLRAEGLDGYLFKSESPSCGLEGVEVWTPEGAVEARGRGVFASALHLAWPELPLAEEGHLDDEPRRFEFLARVLAHARLRDLEGKSRAEALAFHAQERALLEGWSAGAHEALGQVLRSGAYTPERLSEYRLAFLATLARSPETRTPPNPPLG